VYIIVCDHTMYKYLKLSDSTDAFSNKYAGFEIASYLMCLQ